MHLQGRQGAQACQRVRPCRDVPAAAAAGSSVSTNAGAVAVDAHSPMASRGGAG
ncbi:hypothetical protein I551_6937 [Mycobacterium ulcerans str. Harvey]|uniref:Uncharacterized protein n=1 Tax=Mycobacterium ulcerans str. Harvey TaxID=1299332 RepID=A0ABP3A552_MYCUL|nr:hypothetical protein I551_6937 [Mycobacterium ulcerans str. Harvey]